MMIHVPIPTHVLAASVALQGAQTAVAAVAAGTDHTLVLVAIITAIPTTIAAVTSALGLIKSRQIHSEVKTMNALTMGQSVDAAETRRILEDVEPADRTAAENLHIVEAPIDDGAPDPGAPDPAGPPEGAKPATRRPPSQPVSQPTEER